MKKSKYDYFHLAYDANDLFEKCFALTVQRGNMQTINSLIDRIFKFVAMIVGIYFAKDCLFNRVD